MCQVLLIEDNPAQVRLTEEAFKEKETLLRLQSVYDGEAAMDFLKRRGRFTECVRPDLILLDWNIPKKNGAQVLKEIKEDPDLESIPVIILTSSERNEDIIQAYELRSNSFIRKPSNYEDFLKIVTELEEFWVNFSEFSKSTVIPSAILPLRPVHSLNSRKS